MMPAVLLCGGESKRMGRPKIDLPFGDETLLSYVVSLLWGIFSHVVVVAAPGQTLPNLSVTEVLRDRIPGRGPLGGMQSGLGVVGAYGNRAFVAACDMPFLSAELIDRLAHAGSGVDIVCPHDGQRAHPLASTYRTDVLESVNTMLDEGNLPIRHLLCRRPTRFLDASMPRLRTCLQNVNTPEAYELARDRVQRGIS